MGFQEFDQIQRIDRKTQIVGVQSVICIILKAVGNKGQSVDHSVAMRMCNLRDRLPYIRKDTGGSRLYTALAPGRCDTNLLTVGIEDCDLFQISLAIGLDLLHGFFCLKQRSQRPDQSQYPPVTPE